MKTPANTSCQHEAFASKTSSRSRICEGVLAPLGVPQEGHQGQVPPSCRQHPRCLLPAAGTRPPAAPGRMCPVLRDLQGRRDTAPEPKGAAAAGQHRRPKGWEGADPPARHGAAAGAEEEHPSLELSQERLDVALGALGWDKAGIGHSWASMGWEGFSSLRDPGILGFSGHI